MRSISLLLGIVLVLLLAHSNANACSCEGRRPACEAYGIADAVFVGTVIGGAGRTTVIDLSPIGYKFAVEQIYSGVSGTQVEVFSGTGFGDCGFTFQAGERYLVYAHRSKNRLVTSICTRTRLFEQAGEDLAFLGALSSRASGVTLYGEVRTSSAEGKLDPTRSSITIETGTQRREVRPDAQGDFRVDGLSPGRIIVTLKLPEQFTASPGEQDLMVADRGCAQVVWYVEDNGRISGRVVTTSGEPVPRILVTLEDPDDRDRGPMKTEPTDENGQFLFAGVPPGRYLVAVNRTRHLVTDNPANAYAPTFLPGVIDATQARVITLGPGEKVGDLEVPITKRPASTVEGRVIWSDGTPVHHALLRVRDVTYGDSPERVAMAQGMRADEQGRVKIPGYVGQKLIVEARSNRPGVPLANLPASNEAVGQVTITLERTTEFLQIVLNKPR